MLKGREKRKTPPFLEELEHIHLWFEKND